MIIISTKYQSDYQFVFEEFQKLKLIKISW